MQKVSSYVMRLKKNKYHPASKLLVADQNKLKEDYKLELQVVEQWLAKRSFCAIGEIGIDLYWDKTFLSEQIDAFKIQLNWAKDLNIPIVIHNE